ncbi:MAG: DUF2304 domain-containing protein [Oscillospiraceae bacterium]|nr:DUF2304 domain-containing protein [Oscillospiraceae bacterium]
MVDRLQLPMIIISILFIILVVEIVRKDRISVKYSLVWIFSGAVMLVVSLFPNRFLGVARYFGFEVLSNMLFFVGIGLLMLISISLTVIVSGQKKKIQVLIQEVSLLKEKLEDKEG